jgi:hypothetical protein
MRQSIQRAAGLATCVLAVSTPLLLLPIFAADASSGTAPADASRIHQLLREHDARFVMRAYSRVPLQCASELHGA